MRSGKRSEDPPPRGVRVPDAHEDGVALAPWPPGPLCEWQAGPAGAGPGAGGSLIKHGRVPAAACAPAIAGVGKAQLKILLTWV